MKHAMFFLINSIDLNRGGLTKAALKQASLFAEMGYETYMLTFNFNPKYPLIKKKLIENNDVHKNVIIKNMYEEFEGQLDTPLSKPINEFPLEDYSNGLTLDKRDGYNAYRLFDNGLYVKYVSLNEDNSLDFIDYFNENRNRVKREIYDPWGNLKKINFMDLSLNKARQSIYFDDEGKAYLTEWINPNSNKIQRMMLFNKTGTLTNTFINNTLEIKLLCLKRLIEQVNSNKVVIVSDARNTDDILINFNHPKAAKIWRLHSSHLDAPFDVESDIASTVKNGFEYLSSFDAALLLTEEQKKDIEKRIGARQNIKVVPHYHDRKKKLLNQIIPLNKKDLQLCVVVSRLSSIKRLDHIIKAFKIVNRKLPNARLEIWGSGDQKSDLMELIKQLQLEDSIILKGYTQNPDEVYQKGLFSVMTSRREGFGLSILESMYNETPVISYNIKYGPSDLITNDINGFIVEDGNIEELANRMIYLFENTKTALNMGKQAQKFIKKNFSKEMYKEKWLEAVNTAINNKFL